MRGGCLWLSRTPGPELSAERLAEATVVSSCLQATTAKSVRSWRSMGASSKFFKSLITGKRGGGGGAAVAAPAPTKPLTSSAEPKALSSTTGSEKAVSERAPSERSHQSEKEDVVGVGPQKKAPASAAPAGEKTNEKSHKRWTLWRHVAESDQDPESDVGLMSSYSQEFKREQLQVMIDEVSSESPSPYSHSIMVAEWAAIRIQTAYRGFLARRALRALKGLVRLQALVRGHTVRRQAAITLRCMQALVRVQARVRARRVRMSQQGLAVQRTISQRRLIEAQLRESELGWCASSRTKQDLQAKLQQRQEGLIKRERARAYANNHQWRPESHGGPSQVYFNNEGDKPHWGWSWLERWMAARPWENRQALRDSQAVDSPSAVATTAENQENRSLQSHTDHESQKVLAQHSSNNHGDATSKPTSPITSTLIQLQRQQRQMLVRGCNDQALDSDASSPPCSHSNTPSNSERVHPTGRRSYMAATKSAQAKVRAQSTPKQRSSTTTTTPDEVKKRSPMPVREARTSAAAVAGLGLSASSSTASQATSWNSSARGDRASPQHATRRSTEYTTERPSSSTYTRRAPGSFMSASYNVERGSRKASDILSSAYKAGRSSGSQKGPADFMHQSYNLSRPSRSRHDEAEYSLMTASYNHERPRRITEVRQSNAAHESSSSAKKDELFFAHYSHANVVKSRKKDSTSSLSQSLNYERPTLQKKPTSATAVSDVSQFVHRSHMLQHQPRPSSRRNGELQGTRNDVRRGGTGDFLHRSYQSGQSADFSTSLASVTYGDFRRPVR